MAILFWPDLPEEVASIQAYPLNLLPRLARPRWFLSTYVATACGPNSVGSVAYRRPLRYFGEGMFHGLDNLRRTAYTIGEGRCRGGAACKSLALETPSANCPNCRTISPDMKKTRSVSKPNLFRYATKELSQDAMICWLIAWAGQNKSDDLEKEKLRRCGREFVHALLNHKREGKPVELPEEIVVEIHQQDKGIDVLARINGKQALLIEDKTGTGNHSDQLERYYQHVAEGNTKLRETLVEDIYPIYFKRGNQSLAADHRIERIIKGYRVFHRTDFLLILESYKGKNPILVDFKQYLQCINKDTDSYEKWSKDSNKSWTSWEGFFCRLECELGMEDVVNQDWGYVSNRSGGFLGFWRESKALSPMYLQIETKWNQKKNSNEGNLCFKVSVGDESKEEKGRLKWHWHNRIMEAGNRQKQQICKPRYMRIGKTMTVGIWKEDWLAFSQDGKFDIPGTVKNIKRAESVLIAAANAE